MNSPSLRRVAIALIVLIVALSPWLLWKKPPSPTMPSPATPPPSPMSGEVKRVPRKIAATKYEPAQEPSSQSVPAAAISKTEVPATPIPQAIVPPPAPPPEAPLEWQGNDTSITHPGEVVIRNDHQWVQFWSEHHPHEAAPDVDFTQSMVIGVFAGPRPADQFTIRMVEIQSLPGGSLSVSYQEKLPPPGTFAVDVTVYPYHLKVIPRTALLVKFNKLAPIDPNR